MEHRLKAEWCNENTLRPRSIKKSLDDPNRVFYRFKAFILWEYSSINWSKDSYKNLQIIIKDNKFRRKGLAKLIKLH